MTGNTTHYGDLLNILTDPNLDQDVSNRIVASALQGIAERQERMMEMHRETEKALTKIQNTLDEVFNLFRENPSLVWLLRYRTKETVLAIASVFGFSSLIFVGPFRQAILTWLGLPVI